MISLLNIRRSRPNRRLQLTALGAREIGAFLKARISSKAIPID